MILALNNFLTYIISFNNMEFIYILSNSWLLEYITLFLKSQFNSVELSVLSLFAVPEGCQLPAAMQYQYILSDH